MDGINYELKKKKYWDKNKKLSDVDSFGQRKLG